MRDHRLTKEHLKKTRIGNATGAIYIDIYRYLLTNRIRDKIINLGLLVFLGSLLLTMKYKINYFKYGLLRIKTLKKRKEIQGEIGRVFIPLLMEKYEKQEK